MLKGEKLALYLLIVLALALNVNAAYSPDQYTVALWHFDECSGDTAIDSSGNGNTGSLSNVEWTTDSFSGCAVKFNGVDSKLYNDYSVINVPVSSSLSPAQLTLEAWIKRNSNTSGTIISRNAPYYIAINPEIPDLRFPIEGTIRYGVHTDTWHEFASNIRLLVGQWYHIAMTYDGSSLRIFVNGVEDNSIPVTGPLSGGSELNIGWGIPGHDETFDGIIDEVRISNISRTSFDVFTTTILPGFEITGEFPNNIIVNNIPSLLGTRDGTIYATHISNNVELFYNDLLNIQNTWNQGPEAVSTIIYELRDGTVLNLGKNAIYEIDDSNTNWHLFTVFPGFAGDALGMFESSDGTLLVVGQNGVLPNLYVSKNHGFTWTGIIIGGYADILDIAESNDSIYLASYGGSSPGLYKSNDGFNWRSIRPNNLRGVTITNEGNIIIAADFGGRNHIQISRDNGLSWEEVFSTSLGEVPNQFITAENGDIYLATSQGLWKGNVSASNWNKLFTSGPIEAMVLGADGRLYVGAPSINNTHPILRSTFIISPPFTTTTTSTTTTIPEEFYSKAEVDALLAERDARIAALENQTTDLIQLFAFLTERVSSLENTLSSLQVKVNDLFSSLFGLPKGLRQEMVCSAMKATNQTSVSGFGLACSINDKGACSCS